MQTNTSQYIGEYLRGSNAISKEEARKKRAPNLIATLDISLFDKMENKYIYNTFQ